MRRQAIIWINDGLIYWRIDASLGLIELYVFDSMQAKFKIKIGTEFPGK